MPRGCHFSRRVCVYWDNTGYVSAKPNPKTCVSDLSLHSTFAIFVSVSIDLTYAIPHKDSRMGTIVPSPPRQRPAGTARCGGTADGRAVLIVRPLLWDDGGWPDTERNP